MSFSRAASSIGGAGSTDGPTVEGGRAAAGCVVGDRPWFTQAFLRSRAARSRWVDAQGGPHGGNCHTAWSARNRTSSFLGNIAHRENSAWRSGGSIGKSPSQKEARSRSSAYQPASIHRWMATWIADISPPCQNADFGTEFTHTLSAPKLSAHLTLKRRRAYARDLATTTRRQPALTPDTEPAVPAGSSWEGSHPRRATGLSRVPG